MVKITRTGKELRLAFSREEADTLGLSPEKEYDFSKARDGIWLLTENPAKTAPAEKKEVILPANVTVEDTEQKIMGLIRNLPPKDRMEGWFEKKLTAQEKEKFTQMLSKGLVAKFKSSESFRTSLYVPGKAAENRHEKQFDNNEKEPHNYTLEKDGFMVIKNELNAKSLSEQLKDNIKAGEIKGIRTFTGEFYVIQSSLLESGEKKILSELMRETKQTVAMLSEKIKLTPTLVKVCAEFLKDEGQIMEKTQGTYQYIE